MRGHAWCVGVVVLAAGAGFVSQTVQNRDQAAAQARLEEDYAAAEQMRGAVQAARPEPAMPLRDALNSPAPTALPLPAPALAAPRAAAPAAAQTTADLVSGSPLFQALTSGPARFLVSHTFLGKSRSFEQFLKDPRRVKNYVTHPLIRGVLDNPSLLRRVAGNPAVVQAFLSSPAMQDPKTVAALAASPFLDQVAQSRGVAALAADPGFINNILLNPATTGWVGRHPEALPALSKLGLGMSRSMSLPRL